MKYSMQLLLSLFLFTSLAIGCQQGSIKQEEQFTTKENDATSAESEEYAAVKPINDPSRKMMKKADMDIRVQNVNESTIILERSAVAVDGMVTESQIHNQINYTKDLPLSSDSLCRARAYTTKGFITVRIPVSSLDSFLSIAAREAEFINNRNLHLEDATFDYLDNQWKKKEDYTHAAIDKAKNTNDVLIAGDNHNDLSSRQVDRKIENLRIDDAVKYATINISLYQSERIEYYNIANVSEQMTPAFTSQIQKGIDSGWQLVKLILIGITYIWPILLIAVFTMIIWRFRKSIESFWNRFIPSDKKSKLA